MECEDCKKRQELLFAAASEGDAEGVRNLIEQGADVNEIQNGSTALDKAMVSQRFSGCVRLLLEAGANVNPVSESAVAPLMYAIWAHDVELVKLLIPLGADVNRVNIHGRCALSYAIDLLSFDCIEPLLDAGADVNANPDRCALINLAQHADSYGHLVRRLITEGADVNKYNCLGENALMVLAKCGTEELVSFLAERCENIDKKDKYGDTALSLASKSGHVKCVEVLIRQGASVNIPDNGGYTALITSASFGHCELVDILLKAGADVNTGTSKGIRPLLAAVRNQSPSCQNSNRRVDCRNTKHSFLASLELLLQAGANVNRGDDNGNTPLMKALEKRHQSCVQLLIAAGADVNQEDENNTPLVLAIRLDAFELVHLLIQSGADVNQAEPLDGKSPFMVAGGKRKGAKSVRMLLESGAKLNKLDSLGNNALSIYNRQRLNPWLCMLLYAAGEKIPQPKNAAENLPKKFKQIKANFRLKHLCREAIRKHLLDLEPHQHLFGRIPQLGLPSSLSRYVLYNISIDTSQ